MQYAEHPDNWVDIELESDVSKYMIRHRSIEIIYSVEYKNDEDDEGGKLPLRHLSFRANNDIPMGDMKEFINRTLKQFGLVDAKTMQGNKGRIHYYSPLFKL